MLTIAIYEEGLEKVAGGLNPMDLYRGINKAVDVALAEVKRMTKKVEDKEQIRQVATVSANNDKEIGGLIADAISKVGREGAITVETGKTLETEIDVRSSCVSHRALSDHICLRSWRASSLTTAI